MQTTAGNSAAERDLKSLSVQELQAKLGLSPAGLSQVGAQRRLAQYGYNEISEKTINPLLKFLGYFWGPIPWMLSGIFACGVFHEAVKERCYPWRQ